MADFSQVLRGGVVEGASNDPLGLGVYCAGGSTTTALVTGAVVADAVPVMAWETQKFFSRWRLDGKITGGADAPFPALYVEVIGHALRDDVGFLLGSGLWLPASWSTSEAVLQVSGILARYWEVRAFVQTPAPGTVVNVGWLSTWDRFPGQASLVRGPNVMAFP